MIPILEKYNDNEALGLLLRASISLTLGEDNPAAKIEIDNELVIRESVFNYFREKLGIRNDDYSYEALERIADAIDEESDKFIGEIDYDGALNRLSNRGDLPSSLYTLKLDSDNMMVSLLGKSYGLERTFIENTVKMPDREEHLKPSTVVTGDEDCDSSSLVSLFAKYYPNERRKSDSFIMLVIGQRNMSVLSVNFAIRIYDIALMGCKSLIDMLRGFTKKFGCKINVNGREDYFFYDVEKPRKNPMRNVEVKAPKHVFFQFEKTMQDAIFYISFAIDIKKYRKSLRQHHFKFIPIG